MDKIFQEGKTGPEYEGEKEKSRMTEKLHIHRYFNSLKSKKISGAVRHLDVSYQEQSQIFGDNLTPQPQ